MKKLYIAPEVEIKRFNTEDIMANSGIEAPAAPVTETEFSAIEASNKIDVTYDQLFN